MSVLYRKVLVTLAAAGVLVVWSFSVSFGQAPLPKPLPAPSPGVNAERGKYFVTVMDCNGCHTPFKNGEPDMTRMLSGHPQNVPISGKPAMAPGFSTEINETNTAWAGPWGVSFTTNLTPDRATGIGAWTEQTFINAIRQGKRSGAGRPLLPPMPWRMYGQLTDDDLKSIFAYLRTIPAIANRVPNAIVAAPGGASN
jgi:hypothetical protein